MVKACLVDGDHLSGQLTLNSALIVAVLGKGLLLGQDEVERARLPACVEKSWERPFGLPLTASMYEKSVSVPSCRTIQNPDVLQPVPVFRRRAK